MSYSICNLFLVLKVSARTHQAQLTKLDKSELLDHCKHGASHWGQVFFILGLGSHRSHSGFPQRRPFMAIGSGIHSRFTFEPYTGKNSFFFLFGFMGIPSSDNFSFFFILLQFNFNVAEIITISSMEWINSCSIKLIRRRTI